jgi:hypothetical protein
MQSDSVDDRPVQHQSHRVRSFFSWVFGLLAIYFLTLSIVVFWLNRTVLDTNTYVSTVSPLVTKPDIQNYIATKVTTEILNNSPTNDLAVQLIGPASVNSNDQQQLKALLNPIIYNNVVKIISSSNFAFLWANTNRTAHQEFISQIQHKDNNLIINLNPAITGVISQLKGTQLAPISNKINISSTAGTLTIKPPASHKISNYYKYLQSATAGVILLGVLLVVLTILIAPKRLKAFKRILLGVMILDTFLITVLSLQRFAKIKSSDIITQRAITATANSLFSSLLKEAVAIWILILVTLIGLFIFKKYKISKNHKQSKSNL